MVSLVFPLSKPFPPARGKATTRPRASAPLASKRLEDLCLPSFLDPVSYTVGTSMSLLTRGDFNNDGQLDLAVSNTANNTISVLKGNADGTFQPAVNSDTGGGAVSLATGDFNADGKLDLVTADNVSVKVLLGNGDATFQPPAAFGTGNGLSPVSVAVGDFNADGKLDLGVASSTYIPGGWGYPAAIPASTSVRPLSCREPVPVPSRIPARSNSAFGGSRRRRSPTSITMGNWTWCSVETPDM